ncbi:MAG: glycosyltransferase family 1 protein [Halioglobus sp.]|nr:glycosyltransferase family 1 protein [Halioglobus sp.]
MELIFNAEALRPPVTGVGHYTYHLLEQFLQMEDVDVVHCFSGGSWRDGETQLAISAGQMAQEQVDTGSASEFVQKVRSAIGGIPGSRLLYRRIADARFARQANKLSGAVYHETNFVLKPYAGPSVVTVHDLSHIRHPEFHQKRHVQLLDLELPRSIARADHVVVDSHVVREELLDHFDLPAQRVSAVYAGCDERYRPRQEGDCASVLGPLGLDYGKYVLMVATLEPRKGIDTLLTAWQALPPALREEYTLVLAGSSGWRNEEVMRTLEAMIAAGGVQYLGYADTDILPRLFSGAAVFAYPSVYEGFGLPVLDAMASGVPVVCRQGTSMAEFSRGTCVLCESGEAGELATRLAALLEDAGMREQVARRQQSVAAEFSWRRCAEELVAIYRQLL